MGSIAALSVRRSRSATAVLSVCLPPPKKATVSFASPSSARPWPTPQLGFFCQHTRRLCGHETAGSVALQSQLAILGKGLRPSREGEPRVSAAKGFPLGSDETSPPARIRLDGGRGLVQIIRGVHLPSQRSTSSSPAARLIGRAVGASGVPFLARVRFRRIPPWSLYRHSQTCVWRDRFGFSGPSTLTPSVAMSMGGRRVCVHRRPYRAPSMPVMNDSRSLHNHFHASRLRPFGLVLHRLEAHCPEIVATLGRFPTLAQTAGAGPLP